MKKIYNWNKASVADIEADDLLDNATKIHVLSCSTSEYGDTSLYSKDDIVQFFEWHIESEIPIVMHNGICYDIPLVEKLYGIDLSKLMVIDTMILSWYLNFDRKLHGLDSFLADYGIEKPKIDDWKNLTLEEYTNRCAEDVKINKALWEDLRDRLIDMYSIAKEEIDLGNVGGKRVSEDEVIYLDRYIGTSDVEDYINRILTFLMHKQSTVALREKCGWKINRPHIERKVEELTEHIEKAKAKLESVMDDVPSYVVRNKPKKPTKKDGTLSASGERWNKAVEGLSLKNDNGHPLSIPVEGDPNKIKVLNGYNPPNANSTDQVKELLFKHGWEPRNFNFVDDKVAIAEWKASGSNGKPPEKRKVPQISIQGENGKELCPSVVDLADECPEIMAYASYTLINHRLGLLEGLLSSEVGGRVRASVRGLTNTFRDKHKEIVNLPGIDKPYGKDIRGSLICEDDQVQLGSDLSSLEDRVKHHYMIPHDPEYVETMMAPDFDPHILTALQSGFITEEKFKLFKSNPDGAPKTIKKHRKAGKGINYSSVYGASAETISRSAGIPLDQARRGREAYWELNWSVEAIAKEQVVITDSLGNKWLINPVNGFLYNIRKEKDIFSTLCQGTGSFFFDIWVSYILDMMEEEFGVRILNGAFHDEYISIFYDHPHNRQRMEEITKEAIQRVNKEFMLRRELDCDVQFGKTYADIH